LLCSLGVQPDAMLGHSSGESSALAASGAIPADSAQQLAAFIRQLNAVYEKVLSEGKISTGALLAVGALANEEVEAHIAATAPEVVVAMDNCANQLVLYGASDSIATLQKVLTDAGAICMPLPFDRGYHTPAFAGVSAAFLKYYKSVKLDCPRVPMYSCASADRFPDSATAVRQLAAQQWSGKVRFRETVLKMHADGVRYFVEVGPSGNLTAFVNDILAGKEHVTVASNLRRRNGVEQLLVVLAQLYVNDKPVAIDRLFADRGIAAIDLAAPVLAASRGAVLDNTMPVLRFSEADKAALRELTASSAPPVVHAEPLLEMAPEPVGMPATEATNAPIEPDARAGVMAEYFDVMRGFLDQQRAMVQAWQSAPADGELVEEAGADGGLSFLSEITEHDADHLVARCHLSLNDNFLKSHVLSGRVSESDPDLSGLACVPLMVSLEIMAQACVALSGHTAVRVIENVRAFDWIALDDGALTLEVRAERVDQEGKVCRAELFNAGSRVVSAEFGVEPEWQLGSLVPLANAQPSRWAGPELYSTGMFHGPVFQSVREIDSWNDAGIDALLFDVTLADFFIEGQTPALVLNPVLLDAVGQLAAYWVAQQVGTDFNCFPSTIGRIELYAPCPADLPGLTMRSRQQPLDASAGDVSAARSWQFECLDASGTPLLRVDKLVNIFFAVPHSFYEVRRDPLNGLLGRPHAAAQARGVSLWEVPHYAEDFCAQSGGIFLRILAHALLSFDERDAWRSLTGSVRRRREWLLGRAAIKEAVRVAIHERTGHLLYPSDITVLHDDLGAPFVDGGWRDSLGEAPSVSLSHTARGCLVAVGASSAVGVDFEDIGRVQQPGLLIDTLTPFEREQVLHLDGTALDERLLRLWCAKEATAKYLGIGLQGRPEAFEVRFADESFAEAFVGYEESTTRVSLVREGQTVIAVAADEYSGIEVH
jgi:malonyl CoA-acyl carrier protein transacylase/phosphopantetheinyl transferase (holo-ACP synthase)